jgi:hypothetical protein
MLLVLFNFFEITIRCFALQILPPGVFMSGDIGDDGVDNP